MTAAAIANKWDSTRRCYRHNLAKSSRHSRTEANNTLVYLQQVSIKRLVGHHQQQLLSNNGYVANDSCHGVMAAVGGSIMVLLSGDSLAIEVATNLLLLARIE